MSGVEVIIGLAAGGVGFLSLSIQLAESAMKLRTIYHSMRDAPQALKDVADEIEILSLSLKYLERHRQQESHGVDILDRCIEQCRKHASSIEELSNKVSQKFDKAPLVGRLYAATQERDFDKLLEDLARARAALHLAVDLYHKEEQDRRWLLQQEQMSRQHDQIVTLQRRWDSHHESMIRQTQRAASHCRVQDAQETAEPIEDDQGTGSSNQLVKFQGRKNRYRSSAKRTTAFRIKLKLTPWFSSRIWELARIDAEQGWDLCFRTYNVRDGSAPIFMLCGSDNLEEVKRLIRNGEASIFDVDPDGHTLFEYSMSRHGFWPRNFNWDTTSWLLKQNIDIDESLVLDVLLNSSSYSINYQEEALRLFLDEAGFEVGFQNRCRLLRSCWSFKDLAIILRDPEGSFRKLSPADRAQVGANAFWDWESADLYVAKMGLALPDLAMAHFIPPHGGSALHHVAEALASRWAECDCGIIRRDEKWIRLGTDLIRHGADLFALSLGENGDSTTPLLHLLLHRHYTHFSGSRNTSEAHKFWTNMLDLWIHILEESVVDLELYFVRELDIWARLGWKVTMQVGGLPRKTTRLVMLTFNTEQRRCSFDIRNEVCIPIMQLQQTPGSFDGPGKVSQNICWHPSREEEEEGHWSQIDEIVLRGMASKRATVFDDPLEPYQAMMNCSQDDNDHLLRMMRYSCDHCRSNTGVSSRCWVLNTSSRYDHEGQIALPSRIHRWLQYAHFFRDRSKWVFTGNGTRPVEVIDPRMCVTDRDPSFEGPTSYCKIKYSFLGEILDCQNGIDDDFRGLNQAAVLRHDSKSGCCPQGCNKVDLSKLQVPTSLPEWHPCFGFKSKRRPASSPRRLISAIRLWRDDHNGLEFLCI